MAQRAFEPRAAAPKSAGEHVRATRSGDALVVRAGDVDEANRWVSGLGARGARLRSMTQARRQLEEIYIAHLERSNGPGAADDT